MAAKESKSRELAHAIVDLGAAREKTRIGAIHALERIAQTSRTDNFLIRETLADFIRQNAPWTCYSRNEAPDRYRYRDDEDAYEESQNQPESNPGRTTSRWSDSPEDIQAAINLLASGIWHHEDETTPRLNLRETLLRNLELSASFFPRGIHFERADFTRSNLEGASLREAFLTEAIFTSADLDGCSFVGAHLQRANFERAELGGAQFEKARLHGANFSSAYLEESNWFMAEVAEAQFCDAHLNEAQFIDARMRGANLQGANLEDAHMHGSHLEKADMKGANLARAIMSGTYLEGASLKNANLKGAILDAGESDFPPARGLTQAQIDQAIVDENTRLPYPLINRATGKQPKWAPHFDEQGSWISTQKPGV